MLQNSFSRKIYLGLLGLAVLLSFHALKNKLRLVSYQQDPDKAAWAFMESLKNNDESMAKSLALVNQHERISLWMNTHQATKCGFLSFEFRSQILYSINHEQVNVGISCEYYRGVYCFNIENIWVKKIEQKWFVADWGDISEGYWLHDRDEEIGDCP